MPLDQEEVGEEMMMVSYNSTKFLHWIGQKVPIGCILNKKLKFYFVFKLQVSVGDGEEWEVVEVDSTEEVVVGVGDLAVAVVEEVDLVVTEAAEVEVSVEDEVVETEEAETGQSRI